MLKNSYNRILKLFFNIIFLNKMSYFQIVYFKLENQITNYNLLILLQACHEDDTDLISAAIRNLKYGKEYKIVVRAVSDAGFGELSKPIFIRTDGDTANVKYKETINQKQKLGIA